MVKLSVVILTYNEAVNIRRCIESVRGVADEVLVIDSFSSDNTVAIARECGARVVQNPWENYNIQRAFGAKTAEYDHVLALDADEYLDDDLRRSLLQVKESWTKDAYRLIRLNRIGNTWIRHTSWYPDRKLRLFDRRKVEFVSRAGHDIIQLKQKGTIGKVQGHLLHLANFNLHERALRDNETSTEGARYYYQKGRKGSWLRILFKPFFRFFVEYFLRLGFLSGFYGYAIARTAAHYVFLREAKLLEMNRFGKPYSKNNWKH